VEPLFVQGDNTVIKRNSTQSLVLAIPSFTISKDKYITIEVMEKEGGRDLILKVKSSTS
jgi:hypothetical protein